MYIREFTAKNYLVHGHALFRKFSDAIRDEKIVLGKDDTGKRTVLGLRTADELMSGYRS